MYMYVYVSKNNTRSSWDRQSITVMNQLEFALFFLSIIGVLYCYILYPIVWGHVNVRVGRMWLEASLLRILTLLLANRNLVLTLYTVVPNFLSLVALAGIFIMIWARIGTTLFSGKSSVVLEEIYQASSQANFDTLSDALLALVQIMLADNWSDIMYVNVLATRYWASFYFIIFVVLVTLFSTNLFVGLILAGIEESEKEQEEQMMISKCLDAPGQVFYNAALDRKKQLQKQLDTLNQQLERMDLLVKVREKRVTTQRNASQLFSKTFEDEESSPPVVDNQDTNSTKKKVQFDLDTLDNDEDNLLELLEKEDDNGNTNGNRVSNRETQLSVSEKFRAQSTVL
ncbi:hypothetical protein RFI_32835 [Reticulomyxa filosa]|uniref:Ion transport domain-containing protein n=1 Tax=Reticulomyxa filosa TaxID=46433 RepID=X6LT53_RETFI|nr:hypothetical protein RFI_32835 [Reticulomyxa filosa]|eukprot:ETO04561.1 hypothetical protein RFI_32835 [Reticulomyxa filosa]